jgi:hypothetical protein
MVWMVPVTFRVARICTYLTNLWNHFWQSN